MASNTMQQIVRTAWSLQRQEATSFMLACRARRLITSHHTKVQMAKATNTGAAKRTFSTSPTFQATVTKQNPRKDEEGNEMAIVISERAAKRLRQITSAPAQKNTLTPSSSSSTDSHLRVAVTSGGCHGFQYLMSLEGSDKIDPEEDTIFTFEDAGGLAGTAEVVLDESSLELLKGSTVDFTTELIGSQFKIVGNPRATSSCGCGTSFDIE